MTFWVGKAVLAVCRAAVQFEKGAYPECIADCDKAVERGRELRADYKMVAKALTRKGNALVKLDQLSDAISTYHKALTEHRSACNMLTAVLGKPWRTNCAMSRLSLQDLYAYLRLDTCRVSNLCE